MPDLKKWVAIGAPHTSNWDFPFMVAASWVMGVRLRWMGKAALFKGPLGPMMRALGGISVDRTQSNDLVQQMVDWFEKSDALVVAVPPSGTRSYRDHWKTGFYFIAQKAQVPVGLGVLDFKEKAAGFTGLLMPSGDIERDFAELKDFYAPIGAKHPRVPKFGATETQRPLKPAQNRFLGSLFLPHGLVLSSRSEPLGSLP